MAAAALLVPTLALAAFGVPCDPGNGRSVAIFYYAWYGTPDRDGGWQHWNQQGAEPPLDLGSSYYPARGAYSSDDASIVAAQMREIAGAGVDTVIVSWWGRGSEEDARLPLVLAAARREKLRVAAHLEPYDGRSAATVTADLTYLRELGIRDVYVYDSSAISDEDWAGVNAAATGMRLFANTRLAGKAMIGGFAGLYTYDVLLYDPDLFPRMCAHARRMRLICAPSVGPGYDARHATSDRRVRPRRDGRRYDSMWNGAVRANADVVTITSYNEWHEGTQIEPAKRAGARYASYDGAWGRTGRAASSAYLERTAYWSGRFRGGVGGTISQT
jgi:glycosyl hydrolase family 99